ncbi:MAG: CHC2 zinc finger domain-containing protein [Rhodobacteraceae bacterium]|nr:CHC2 zinc finger domain-containing protein [Paracoccaceae bacterium]
MTIRTTNKDHAARKAGYASWREFINQVRRTARCEDIAARWAGLELTAAGSGWLVCCPFHPDATPSCHVSGPVFYCHGSHCDAQGDVITFARQIGNLGFEDTLFVLAEEYGLSCPDLGRHRKQRQTGRWPGKRQEAPTLPPAQAVGNPDDPREWPLAEIPEDAPMPRQGCLRVIFPKIGELSVLRATSWYPYRDLDGRLVAMVARRNRTGGGKDIYPLTWRIRPADQMGYWTVTGWPSGARKPVYGVERMSGAKPPLSLLVVEGEKTADAAAELLWREGWICLSPMGGGKAAAHADWTFLAKHYASVSDKTVIVLWPDADQPNGAHSDHCPATAWGNLVLDGVTASFGSPQDMAQHCLIRMVVPGPTLPRGWDLVDFDTLGRSHAWLRAAIANARRWNNSSFNWEMD